MVLLNGPVQNALFCLMDRYRNVCVWFMARNCRFLKGWNSWFPTWEPWVTIASNCRFPEVGTHASKPGNHRLPLQRTSGSYRLGLMFSTWEPKATIARNCRFPHLETHASQPGNERLPTWEPEVTIAGNSRFLEVRTYVFEAKRLSW